MGSGRDGGWTVHGIHRCDGAKALGEPPVVPVFAAVANAVANATGVRLHEAPLTPPRVRAALTAAGVG